MKSTTSHFFIIAKEVKKCFNLNAQKPLHHLIFEKLWLSTETMTPKTQHKQPPKHHHQHNKPPRRNKMDVPTPQPFHQFNPTKGTWEPIDWESSSPSPSPEEPKEVVVVKKSPKIRLITWNIDFQQPFKTERMTAALKYLSKLLDKNTKTKNNNDNDEEDEEKNIPTIIFFQEMKEPDLELIQNASWVRERFYVTDVDGWNWVGVYGTVTLIEKSLVVQRVFRVYYECSRMQRDGLFVDIEVEVDVHPGTAAGTKKNVQTLRLCNTHLESLKSTPPRRPKQLNLASQFMHGNPTPPRYDDDDDYKIEITPTMTKIYTITPDASILAGDLNAFAPEDMTAPIENGLKDAFLVLGGKDGTEESFTWGQQVPDRVRERFGCSRMDKMLFCGKVVPEKLDRIGAGLKVWVNYPNDSGDLSDSGVEDEDGEEVWVTDHLGLKGVFRAQGTAGDV